MNYGALCWIDSNYLNRIPSNHSLFFVMTKFILLFSCVDPPMVVKKVPCGKIVEQDNENEEEEVEDGKDECTFDKTYSDDDWDDFQSFDSSSSDSEFISPR